MSSKFLVLGVLFAALWASAAAAGKLALAYVQPLVLYQVRFFLAGGLLLLYVVFVKKERLPNKNEWKQLAIFGFLNTTLYLSLFVLALNEISAGIGSLSTSTNTLMISVMSAVWLKERVNRKDSFALIIGFLGVVIACYPLLLNNFATPRGLMLIFLSMASYSVATIYYSKIKWELSRISVNGWQVIIGGIMMLPLTIIFYVPSKNSFNATVWISEFWMAVMVSIAAILLWMYLLKVSTAKASLFLFLCPIFGFVYANILLDEPITLLTWIGTGLVILGLYMARSSHKPSSD